VVDGRSLGDMPNMIHKTHLGGILAKNNYNYAGVLFDQGGYSQDIRNCQKCHDGANPATPQGNNWKTVPSRLACGGCHDGINFATGTGVTLKDANAGLTSTPNAHPVGPVADDSLCTLCHGPTADGKNRIEQYHLPVTPPNKGSALHVAGGSANTNAAWIASNSSRLPEGAIKVSYEIQSTSLNAARNPVMVFRMLQNGARKDLNVFATAAVNPATGQKEIWDNFMGAPSVYFVFAVPQDGIAAPADFNATASVYLRSLWAGTATGTLTGPDANGWYTATLTGSTVPANAVMLTGGVGYSYNASSTLPLTQTNLAAYPVPDGSGLVNPSATNKTGGLIVIAPNVQRVAAGFSGRRAIVEDARCNACHQELGTFTEDAFHAGQRNDGTTCSWCHTPNRASSGWTAETGNMTHAIHGAAKRSVPYTWHSAVTPGDSFAHINYPGILARCEQCHLPGTFDFSATASANAAGLGADQIDKRQYREVASGTLSATDISLSPYVTAGVNYGARFSFNAGTGVTTPGAGTNLVTSPTTNACVGCHDSNLAVSHMQLNGGSFYAARSSAIGIQEQCFVCHAGDRVASIRDVHAR
jgi:OmcA/MtrC family decaheme c-type cytochrome